jgi:hypothetical protein
LTTSHGLGYNLRTPETEGNTAMTYLLLDDTLTEEELAEAVQAQHEEDGAS